MMAGRAGARHRPSPASSRDRRCRAQPVDLVPPMPAGRQGARHRRQFRQRQRLHRPRRLAGGREHRGEPRRALFGCDAAARSSSPRPASSASRRRPTGSRRAARHRRQAVGRGLGGGGARDHDHRHLPQGRRPRPPRSAAPVHDQRLRQGLGHDRARHGDDARLSSSPTPRCPRRCCRRCCPRRPSVSFNSITVDGDTSTSDTRAALRDAAGQAPARSTRCRRPAAGRVPRARSRGSWSTSRSRSPATARAPGNSSPST